MGFSHLWPSPYPCNFRLISVIGKSLISLALKEKEIGIFFLQIMIEHLMDLMAECLLQTIV